MEEEKRLKEERVRKLKMEEERKRERCRNKKVTRGRGEKGRGAIIRRTRKTGAKHNTSTGKKRVKNKNVISCKLKIN